MIEGAVADRRRLLLVFTEGVCKAEEAEMGKSSVPAFSKLFSSSYESESGLIIFHSATYATGVWIFSEDICIFSVAEGFEIYFLLLFFFRERKKVKTNSLPGGFRMARSKNTKVKTSRKAKNFVKGFGFHSFQQEMA